MSNLLLVSLWLSRNCKEDIFLLLWRADSLSVDWCIWNVNVRFFFSLIWNRRICLVHCSYETVLVKCPSWFLEKCLLYYLSCFLLFFDMFLLFIPCASKWEFLPSFSVMKCKINFRYIVITFNCFDEILLVMMGLYLIIAIGQALLVDVPRDKNITGMYF